MNDAATAVIERPSGASLRISSAGVGGDMTAAAISRCSWARLIGCGLIGPPPQVLSSADEDSVLPFWLPRGLHRSWECGRPTRAAWVWGRSARWRVHKGPRPDR